MSSITTIEATDTIAASRSTVNDNFSALNTGKVEKAASSTDNAIARFDGTDGDTVQNSVVTVDDSGVLSGVTQLNVDNVRVDGNTVTTTDTNGNLALSPNGSGVVTSATTFTARSATSTTAGGASAYLMGSSNIGIYWGSGAPGASAAKGSIYLRTDGSSTSTRLYVNTDGSATWTNVTTAA